ncbi:hypothetical protein EVJ58_g11053 [Rhodofomes roseus]|uniref:Uncharacterized protein n=1 Tax=Rhodofomes roseus TaxID=34475 RepID=A0A4Y9XM53_9APHY|nr:hypothetical protein EVJ58_g11053 [Rhodofomes roseus]
MRSYSAIPIALVAAASVAPAFAAPIVKTTDIEVREDSFLPTREVTEFEARSVDDEFELARRDLQEELFTRFFDEELEARAPPSR